MMKIYNCLFWCFWSWEKLGERATLPNVARCAGRAGNIAIMEPASCIYCSIWYCSNVSRRRRLTWWMHPDRRPPEGCIHHVIQLRRLTLTISYSTVYQLQAFPSSIAKKIAKLQRDGVNKEFNHDFQIAIFLRKNGACWLKKPGLDQTKILQCCPLRWRSGQHCDNVARCVYIL